MKKPKQENQEQKKPARRPRRVAAARLDIRLLPAQLLKPDEQGRKAYGIWFPEIETLLGIRVWAKSAPAARRLLSEYILNELDGKDDIKEGAW